MVREKVVVTNKSGLHLRPAGLICKLAIGFQCSIHFQFHDTYANAKSVLSVLSACVKCGDEVEFVCDGEDEEEALQTLVTAIRDGLGEG